MSTLFDIIANFVNYTTIVPFKWNGLLALSMSEESTVESQLDENAEPPVSDEEQSIESEEASLENIEVLQAKLKRSRWNVFTFLGLAFLMFAFALFPFPFEAEYGEQSFGSVTKDTGFVWGPSPSGEDFMDVPLRLDVEVIGIPAVSSNITLEAFVLKLECSDNSRGEAIDQARQASTHEYQYQTKEFPAEGETYTFDFDVDMGRHCVIVQFVDDNNEGVAQSGTNLKVKGKLWPNQIIAGVPGVLFIGLSIFAFIGAQKIGARVKSMLEDEKVSDEQLVLEEAKRRKIAQGPSGPPQPVAGPSGAPPAKSPSGPSNVATTSASQSTRSGPPPQVAPQTEATPQPEAVAEQPEQPTEGDGAQFEDAGNGYFYKKLADGTYEQVIYIKDANGSYVPYQSE